MPFHLFPNNNGNKATKDNSSQSMEVKYILFFNYMVTNNFSENIKPYSRNACNLEKNNRTIIRENKYMRNIFNGLMLIQLIKLQNIFKDTSCRHLGFSNKELKVGKKLYLKIYLL